MRALKKWTFFCITPPELTNSAVTELIDKKDYFDEPLEPKTLKGGFEIELAWKNGRLLNHVLKIPTRVLVRLEKFKASRFPDFFNKTAKINWNPYLKHPIPIFHITAQHCRLNHTKRLEETFLQGLKKSYEKSPFHSRWEKEKLNPDDIYIRGENDEWTVSLDTSGDALYKRGHDIKNKASIRETYAAFAIHNLFNELKSFNLSQNYNLIDPMCGSGTLLLEATEFYQTNKRKFSYESSQLNLGVLPVKEINSTKIYPINKCYGFDIDSSLILNLKTRYPELNFEIKNFFSDLSHYQDITPYIIISNPPYGERLEIEKNFVKNLIKTLNNLSPKAVVLIAPKDWNFQLKGFAPTKITPFTNSSIPVHLLIWIFP